MAKVKYHRRPLVIPKETPAEQVTLFDRIATEYVNGDRDTFDSLNKSEKDLVIKWLAEALATGRAENYVHNVLWEIDYTRKPVDIETYLNDPQYMGNIRDEIWPIWIDELCHIFDPKNQYAEWLFTGAIGAGKTTAAMIAMSYLIYLNSCLRNPARYYRLIASSRIVFGIYSVTMHQTADVGFDKLKGYLDSSPYFQNVYPRNLKINSQIKFKRHNVMVTTGCVAEGTMIRTGGGDIPIERLCDLSATVYTADHPSRIYSAGFLGVIGGKYQQCIRLLTDDGEELVCSRDHKVLIRSDNESPIWRKAGELHAGEAVYKVQAGEAVNRFWLEETQQGRLFKHLQDVRSSGATGLLSSNQEMSRQSGNTIGSPEAMHLLRQGKSGDGVSDQIPDSSAERSATISQSDMQEVRRFFGVDLLSQELQKSIFENQGSPFHPGVEGQRSYSLEEVLQGQQIEDSGGEVIVSRRPFISEGDFTAEGDCSALVFGESGQARSDSMAIRAVSSGRHGGACAFVAKDSAGKTDEKCERAKAADTEIKIAGDAYFKGRRCGNRILWEQMLLLWDMLPQVTKDFRSYYSAGEGRMDSSSEYGSGVSALQFSKEQEDHESFCAEDEIQRSEVRRKPDVEETARLRPVRIRSIQNAGIRRTYDVVSVDSSSHAIITNGIVTSNSKFGHALGLDVFSVAMDEANFFQEKNDKEKNAKIGQAYQVYNATRARLISRFMHPVEDSPE